MKMIITTFDKYKTAMKGFAEQLYRDNKDIDSKMFFAIVGAIEEVVI